MKLHSSHLGKEKSKLRAREIVYWPGMSRDIENYISNCQACAMYARSNKKEPLMQHEVPQRIWQKVALDIFEHKNENYLVMVDYFSKFFEIAQLKNLTSQSIISEIKNIFSRQGIPDVLFSDNAPPLKSVLFKSFCNEWDFIHKTSSPYHAQSNGLVERTIQTIKNTIKKCEETKSDPLIAFLELRNTPLYNDINSPAQIHYQRSLKSILPIIQKQLRTKNISITKIRDKLIDKQKKQKYFYDRHSKVLPDVQNNKSVYVKSNNCRNIPGTVLNKNVRPRSYNIQMHNSGREVIRNRKFIINRNTSHSSSAQQSKLNNFSDDDEHCVSNDKTNVIENQIVNNNANQTTRSGRIVRQPDRLQLE